MCLGHVCNKVACYERRVRKTFLDNHKGGKDGRTLSTEDDLDSQYRRPTQKIFVRNPRQQYIYLGLGMRSPSRRSEL